MTKRNSTKRELLERLARTDVQTVVTELRREGMSWDDVSNRIAAAYDVRISPVSLRNWYGERAA